MSFSVVNNNTNPGQEFPPARNPKNKMKKTIEEALPELEQIAVELGIKVNNFKVVQVYLERHRGEE